MEIINKTSAKRITVLTEQNYNRNGRSLTGIFRLDDSMILRLCKSKYSTWGQNNIVFLKNGVLHNDYGPAVVFNNDFGKYTEVGFYSNGILLNPSGGPSFIRYDKELMFDDNMNVVLQPNSKIEGYTYHDKDENIHRLDGYAKYDGLGYGYYYIHGRKHTATLFKYHPEVLHYKKIKENKENLKQKLSNI